MPGPLASCTSSTSCRPSSGASPASWRWFIRVTGEAKDVFTIWLHLRQRTLRYETYLLPAPEENAALVYERALRRNHELYGVRSPSARRTPSSSVVTCRPRRHRRRARPGARLPVLAHGAASSAPSSSSAFESSLKSS